MNPLCRDAGVALLPWSPLARGFLVSDPATDTRASARSASDDTARKFYGRPADLQVRQALHELARDRGVPPATLAYAWLLHKGVTAPIVGASKAWQLDEAVAAVELRLTPEEIVQLEAGYEPHPVIGHA